MTSSRLAAVLSISLIACGGDGNPTKHPDAPMAMPDAARVCTGVTSGMLDFAQYDATNKFIEWKGPITGDLGTGNQLVYQLEFYGGIEASLAGTFDLHTGNQSNYSSCAICVRAFEVNTQGQIQKKFYQSGGSITLTEDPLTNQHLVASISNLQLEEVTIDPNSFASTPVPGGACMSVANFMADHDKVPNAWTCTHADYAAGTTCNCVCGLPDPDCTDTATVAGCTNGTDRCLNDKCVAPVTVGDTCQTATPITLATPVTGTTAGAKHNYDLGLDGTACTGSAQPGPDTAYSIVVAATEQLTVTLSGLAADYDGSIALVGPDTTTPGAVCDASPITTCVAGKDAAGNGGTETFSYTAAPGTYYIIVDSWDYNVGGAYTLTVTSP